LPHKISKVPIKWKGNVFFPSKNLIFAKCFFKIEIFFLLAAAAVAEAWHSKCRYQINKIISIFLSNSENIVFY
jgi:hypothetical protein